MVNTTSKPEAYLFCGKKVKLQRINRFGDVKEQEVMIVDFKQLNLLQSC